MRLSRSRLVLATVTVLTVLPLAAAPTMARDGGRADHDRVVSYWTRDRIANAVPRDFVKSGANELASPKGNAKPTTGGGIKGASWTGNGPVVTRTGKVYFSMGGGNWIFSGTVVTDTNADSSMVLTAGHCAIDEKTGIFATNWMFIPAFDTKPTYTCSDSVYGCWTATALVVRNEFATAGSFNTQAITNDWALAVVGPGGKTTTAQLDATVGNYPMAFNGVTNGDKLDAFGYPAAGKYHGSDLIYCEGAIGTDARMANATWGMPCDMTGGSSGGPWIKGFTAGGGGTLSSLNSYGYSGSAVMYGPMFNSRTQATYDAALTATANRTVPLN